MTEDQCVKHRVAYERLASITDFRGQPSAQFLNTDEFAEIWTEALESVSAIHENESGIWECDCPWQASTLLFLYALLLAHQGFPGRSEVAESLGLEDLGVTLTIFRGQKDPNWGFVPTAHREDLPVEVREITGCATRIFCDVLYQAYLGTGGNALTPNAFYSVAQHYGLPTTLLDFTTDPAVAVFFANHNSPNGSTCAVYSLPLANVLDQVRICLPPPFAKRLYLQKGFFIDASNGNANHVRELSRKTTFKARNDFVVHRWSPTQDDFSINLLPEAPLFKEVSERARVLAQENLDAMELPESALELVSNLCAELDLVEKVNEAMNTLESWFLAVEEILGQLAVFRTGTDIKVAKDVLNKIALDNLPLASLLMDQSREQAERLAVSGEGLTSMLELALAKSIECSLVRAQWFVGELELTDDELMLVRKGEISQQTISNRAFQIWEHRNCTHGHDVDDWLRAELELYRER